MRVISDMNQQIYKSVILELLLLLLVHRFVRECEYG
jgi:hypothetical protein